MGWGFGEPCFRLWIHQASSTAVVGQQEIEWGGSVCLRPDDASAFDPVTMEATFSLAYGETNGGPLALLPGGPSACPNHEYLRLLTLLVRAKCIYQLTRQHNLSILDRFCANSVASDQ